MRRPDIRLKLPTLITIICVVIYTTIACSTTDGNNEVQTEEERLNLGPDQAANDPDVFFFEDFETNAFGKSEEYTTDPERLTVTVERAEVFAGQRSMYVPTPASGGYTGGEAKYWFLPGYQQVYFRFYVKFDSKFEQLHHFCSLRGGRIDDRWSAFGKAGTRPDGTDRFTVTIDPYRDYGRIAPPGKLVLYTYWPDMTGSSDGKYWGNHFEPETPFIPTLGRWSCMEIMIKCNTLNNPGEPGNEDGEMAFWIDGEKIGHYYGFRWRDTDEVLINSLVVGTYIADGEADHPNKTWFDNVAASTSYIGPVAAKQ